MAKEQTVTFTFEDTSETVEFYIIEQTRINNINYLLVADSMDDEAEALILKEKPDVVDSLESVYDIVEDDNELDAIAKVFTQMLDDVDIEL